MKIAIMATDNEDDFKSRQTKYLHEIIDKPMIAYSIEQAKSFSPDVMVVAGINDPLRAAVIELGAKFIEEAAAAEFFAAFGDEPVLVIEGDDFGIHDNPNPDGIKPHDALNMLIRLHKSSDAPATYIYVDDYVWQNERQQRNTQPYVVAAKHFAPLSEILEKHPNAEPYTPHVPPSGYFPSRIFSRMDMSNAISLIVQAVCVKHMKAGVTIHNNFTTVIGSDVTIEPDVIIHQNVEITGKTHIGGGTVIRSGTRIHNMTIGADCEIEQSVLLGSTIGDGTSVGPFAYIRPGSLIGRGCRIGDFVEIKNSTIGDNSKASHLGYIGDSIVGANVNFGCGSITVNYDGVRKNTTVIEDGVFVGSNSNLVAPVRLGKDSFVAAGSTVTRDIPPGELAIARQRQENKANWKRPTK